MQPPASSAPPHYECLGVDPSITAADLARHYKKLSLQLHPDRAAYRSDAAAGDEAAIQARYQRITEAYGVLSDPERRSAYDTKHGVNFQSRLVRLQAVIGQHNSQAVQRSTAGGGGGGDDTPAEAPATVSAASAVPATDPARGDRDASSEDDEDYDPHETVAPPRRGVGVDQQCDDGDSAVRLFSLYPRAGDTPETQYRGISLSRALVSPTSACARTWGLRLDGNAVVGVQDEFVAELGNISGLAAVPFPAVVQQMNDTMVLPSANLPRLLSRLYDAEAASRLGATASTSPAATEQLHFVLAYSTATYDLVGAVDLLRDDDTMQQLVPSWCTAPLLAPLLPDATVLAVNGTPVRSADELRAALRAAAGGSAGVGLDKDEAGVQAMKRARTSAPITVVCCELPDV
ncbi:DnaJ domain containing protein [Novymonas esmeraldas]|uniref:DnaJ domain containing protein n=1 Tax=Novymonas esmeraldas TaxID=1808958 RepID=A0AAW0EUD9_9TRYP